MSKIKIILILACVGVLYFVSTIILDRYAVPLFSPNNDRKNLIASIDGTTSAAGPMITLSDSIHVMVPQSLRISETKPITVVVGLEVIGHFDDDFFNALNQTPVPGNGTISTDPPEPPSIIHAYEREYTINVSADQLSIFPTTYVATKKFDEKSLENYLYTSPLEWQWTLSAEKPGDRLILISGLKLFESAYLGRNWDIPEGAAFITQDILTVPVTILTESGLTATQNDWLRIASVFVAILATILGMSVWKWFGFSIGKNGMKAGSKTATKNKLILPGDPDFD